MDSCAFYMLRDFSSISYKFIMKSDTKGTAVYSSDALSVNW